MKIDVIIPTYRPGRKFLELMKRLTSQSVKADRIIIMNTEEKYFAFEAQHEKGDYVLCLSVSPEHRKCGIGRALLSRYLQDKKEVSLECLQDNLPSRRLYESLGFAVTEAYAGYAAPHSPPVPVLKMICRKNQP